MKEKVWDSKIYKARGNAWDRLSAEEKKRCVEKTEEMAT